jgi:hypothetical protein
MQNEKQFQKTNENLHIFFFDLIELPVQILLLYEILCNQCLFVLSTEFKI